MAAHLSAKQSQWRTVRGRTAVKFQVALAGKYLPSTTVKVFTKLSAAGPIKLGLSHYSARSSRNPILF
jgi:hypothetical protein